MPKDPPKSPLTPAKTHLQIPNQEDPTFIPMPLYPFPPHIPKKDQKNSKCLVYCLTLFVILCFVVLVFSSVVVRIKNPNLNIDSISLKSLKYDYSPAFNMTLSMKISIWNRYFGHLELVNQKSNSVSLAYADTSTMVGHSGLMFPSDRIEARGKEAVGIVMQVSSSFKGGLKPNDKTRVHDDLNSGVLGFTSYAQLKGKIHLFKKLRLSTLAVMSCTFQIDLGHPSVQRLKCSRLLGFFLGGGWRSVC